MSLQTWKTEYYSVPANQVAKQDALAHSLQKWEGLRLFNLRCHEVFVRYDYVADQAKSTAFYINSSTCALCYHYVNRGKGCEGCPLYVVRGGVTCDKQLVKEKRSPYHQWLETQSPTAMLRWLKKAQKMVQQQAKAKGGQ